jgi:hypothetical protein
VLAASRQPRTSGAWACMMSGSTAEQRVDPSSPRCLLACAGEMIGCRPSALVGQNELIA